MKTDVVLDSITSYYYVTRGEIRSRSRMSGTCILARQMASYLLCYYAKLSFAEIGALMERRPDSVLHRVYQMHMKVTGENPLHVEIRHDYERLMTIIEAAGEHDDAPPEVVASVNPDIDAYWQRQKHRDRRWIE